MTLEDDWYRLVSDLDAWTAAREIAPGRIEVSLPEGAPRSGAVIVMTPEEWDDMAGVMWGDVDDAVADVKRTLLALGPEEAYAVYSQYRLEPSVGSSLRPEPAWDPVPAGTWVAHTRDGQVASRFADHVDGPNDDPNDGTDPGSVSSR